MKKWVYKWNGPVLHMPVLQGALMVLVLILSFNADCAEDMYIITTVNGAEIIVKDYTFTDERVEFTTGNDLPGFIRREDFVKISNMIGVTPEAPVPVETLGSREDREDVERWVWFASATVILVLYLLYLAAVTRKRKEDENEDEDIHYGRVEMDPITQGHLGFQYCGLFGRKSAWVIEVRNAYMEDGIFFVEGISTQTGKRKTFRADRVDGLVSDLSSGQKDPIDKFFVDADGQEE